MLKKKYRKKRKTNMSSSIDSLSLSILLPYTVLMFVIYESLFLVCQEI